MSNYSYEINPRTAKVGGGWQLRLLQDGEEVGGGVFPPAKDIDDAEKAAQAAYDDAFTEAESWLASGDDRGYKETGTNGLGTQG